MSREMMPSPERSGLYAVEGGALQVGIASFDFHFGFAQCPLRKLVVE
jgi:hypothetical protein